MDPDVEDLVRGEQLLDAARLASERGDAHDASVLYERACDWASAAREARRAGEHRRAVELAIESGDDALCEDVVTLLEPKEALATATRLSGRGRDRWAARLLEIAGKSPVTRTLLRRPEYCTDRWCASRWDSA